MYPNVEIITELLPDSSVVIILEDDKLPDWLVLTRSENEYVRKCINEREEIILINSYYKLSLIIPEKEFDESYRKHEELRRKASRVREILKQHKKKEIVITSDHDMNSALSFTEGLILSSYEFNKYKKEEGKNNNQTYPSDIYLFGDVKKNEVEWINAVGKGVYFARDLVNEPNNYLSASDFADIVKQYAGNAGVQVDVYGRKKIEALRMGGILAVNKGSLDPPTFSILEWNPPEAVNNKPVILVGKGVMFDTGGINLKPTSYIEDMKADMAGGAVVAAVLSAIAEARLNVHVIGLIPATDNRPGRDAFVPGDIITMFNGTRVEIINTDAEGRLILADALSFAGNYDPSLVISIATLTGSAENAFGNQAIATMGNAGREFFDLLAESGNTVYERLAEMPFFEEYGEMIKSEIANLKNLGEKKAGAITAGKFLENFTKYPFIHLDIAGCAISQKAEHYRPRGGTGTGVRLLSEFVRRLEGVMKKNKKLKE
ncbi:MAG: leucyl aminopeptidase family protein [Bacteroidales bacterium]|nr:leucyl aminopeptidase family protein [Bacteroidales bacterium]